MVCMARPFIEPDLETYSGRVAAALRSLREKKKWSVEDVRAKLAEVGSAYICRKCGSKHIGLRTDADRYASCPRHDCRSKTRREDLQIPQSTWYAYEKGKDQGGADLPIDFIPIVAVAFGTRSATSWLPSMDTGDFWGRG